MHMVSYKLKADQVAEKLQAVSTILARADLRGLRVIDVRVPNAPVLTRAGRPGTVSTTSRG